MLAIDDAPGRDAVIPSHLVNLSRSSAALIVGTVSLGVIVAGCGSRTSSADKSSEAPTVASPCPTEAPDGTGTPEWTLKGSTGSVAVTGSTETASPIVKVDAPFSVTQTQVHTLMPGDGPIVAPTAKVSVCYMGVDGRDGHVFDSSYERGAPAEFPLDGVVPGFQKAIAGQKVGSTVAVVMTSADGYPQGQPRAGIEPGDSLIFAIRILGAS